MWLALMSHIHGRRWLRIAADAALIALLVLTLAAAGRDTRPEAPFAFPVVPPLSASIATQYAGHPFVVAEPPPDSPSPTPEAPPPALPVELLIPTLNVHRPIEAVSTDRYGVMKVPVNAWNAGWYEAGPQPGAPGDAVIEGHAGFPGQPMIFGRLGRLQAGDGVVVVLADGSQLLFRVVSMATLPAGASSPGMADSGGPPRLTLVTCSGDYNGDTYTYSERLVVEASYSGLI